MSDPNVLAELLAELDSNVRVKRDHADCMRGIFAQREREDADLYEAQAAAVRALMEDAARLDRLAAHIERERAILLHTGSFEYRGAAGLWIDPGPVATRLREALDTARSPATPGTGT